MLEVLEENNVISKSGAGYSKVGGGYSKVGGKVNRLKEGNQWDDFSKKQVKDGIDLGSYGYDAYNQATNPIGYAMTKAIGGAVKKPSAWISFVKEYAQNNNMSCKEALKVLLDLTNN